MSFIAENKVLWRKLVLALCIISMLGPWTFDLINVPAQYPCDKPFIRLYGDFCGSPMSGFSAAMWIIIILPFFSTLLLIWNKNSRQLQSINLVAWGLAGLLTLMIFNLQANRDQFVHFFYLLWGIWLYILVVIGTIIFEILVLRSNTKPSRDI